MILGTFPVFLYTLVPILRCFTPHSTITDHVFPSLPTSGLLMAVLLLYIYCIFSHHEDVKIFVCIDRHVVFL